MKRSIAILLCSLVLATPGVFAGPPKDAPPACDDPERPLVGSWRGDLTFITGAPTGKHFDKVEFWVRFTDYGVFVAERGPTRDDPETRRDRGDYVALGRTVMLNLDAFPEANVAHFLLDVTATCEALEFVYPGSGAQLLGGTSGGVFRLRRE